MLVSVGCILYVLYTFICVCSKNKQSTRLTLVLSNVHPTAQCHENNNDRKGDWTYVQYAELNAYAFVTPIAPALHFRVLYVHVQYVL